MQVDWFDESKINELAEQKKLQADYLNEVSKEFTQHGNCWGSVKASYKNKLQRMANKSVRRASMFASKPVIILAQHELLVADLLGLLRVDFETGKSFFKSVQVKVK